MDRCENSVTEHAHGVGGVADISGHRIELAGGDRWRSRARNVNPYQQEHDDLFAAIRADKEYNEGQYGADSTMSAILGRMATYSGQVVKWEDAVESPHNMWPESFTFDSEPPVLPDEDGYYPVPVPGKMDPMKA
jgi:hypothetical protein